jgi:hypothetical protein
MCRCAERRTALRRLMPAVAQGDTQTIQQQTGFILRSIGEDGASIAAHAKAEASARIARARQRLAR